jgi:ABC-2 type transport system ATP-binding protein
VGKGLSVAHAERMMVGTLRFAHPTKAYTGRVPRRGQENACLHVRKSPLTLSAMRLAQLARARSRRVKGMVVRRVGKGLSVAHAEPVHAGSERVVKGRKRRYLWGETGTRKKRAASKPPFSLRTPMQKEAGKDGPSRTPVLTVKNVSYWYGAKQALDDVSFEVYPGRVTALLGPNGAGKTTLFSLITRLFDAPTGRIEICGRSASEWGAKALGPLGVVFQQPTLDLDLTVKQNLRYFSALRGLKRKDADERMLAALKALDMEERIGERVRSLNGGHRRRVEIARSLLHGPKLLLLDEPTIGLDVPTRSAIVRHVHDLARTGNIGVLWATHLFDEVEPDDDLLVLDRGKIVARGKAKDVVAETGAKDLGGAFRLLIGGDTEEDVVA